MDQPVGRITQLRLYPIRPLWSLGSGWAAVSGGLAAGGFAFSPETLLNLVLIWFLADPVLGVVWDLGVGNTSPGGQRGIWHRLLSPRLPDVAPPLRLLPYTQPGSPGHRLARRLGRLRRWWQDTFWPEASREFATLVAALGLALLLGAVLGRTLLVLVLFSITLSWLTVLSQEKDAGKDSARKAAGNKGLVTLWYALGEFGIPWLIGAVVMDSPSIATIMLGICYAITYFGLIRYTNDFRLIGTSQAAAALLLAGLRHPLTAGAMAILLMPQWGLHIWAASPLAGRNHPSAPGSHRQYVQPFVILSMLIAALAIAA